jgi:hypothetical protein
METNYNKLFIEVGSYQVNKHDNIACGDCVLLRKVPSEERCIAVLSDGLGSGIKANVLSTMTASMAMSFRVKHEPIMRTARTIMDTLPVDSNRNISYSTFTIVDIDENGQTKIVEFDNPSILLVRNGKVSHLNSKSYDLPIEENDKINHNRTIKLSDVTLLKDDRLVLVSDGVTQSGIGNMNMPFGWGKEVEDYIEKLIEDNKNISARELSRKIVYKAGFNDELRPKDDTSCVVLYAREPRKLLICTGPPFSQEKDKYLAEVVSTYQGRKIVCGGTTSQIIARELHKEIEVSLDNLSSGLPPESQIEGIDLVTEGIITLGAVSKILEEGNLNDTTQSSPAWDILRYVLDADIIDILVGTKINIAHQDPTLPVELEIRRNVMKRLKQLFEEKLLKDVKIEFI